MKKQVIQNIYPIGDWLGIHAHHLNYVRNLVLTFSVASLGYSIYKYSDVDYTTIFIAKYCLVSAIFSFGISAILGLSIALVQDKVFRIYRRISRTIEKQPIVIKDEIEQDFDESSIASDVRLSTKLETVNKFLFLLQLIIYVMGVILLTISIFEWG